MRDIFSVTMVGEAVVAITISLLLSLVMLVRLPDGGVITIFSVLPIMIFSFRHGVIKGMMVGILLGLFKIALGAYYFVPFQALLEYPVALSTIGFVGIYKNSINRQKIQNVFLFLLCLFGILSIRFAIYVFSGVLFFSDYALNQSTWEYFAKYHSNVLIENIAICIIFLFPIEQKIQLWKKRDR